MIVAGKWLGDIYTLWTLSSACSLSSERIELERTPAGQKGWLSNTRRQCAFQISDNATIVRMLALNEHMYQGCGEN
jgi:hypothetical protein